MSGIFPSFCTLKNDFLDVLVLMETVEGTFLAAHLFSAAVGISSSLFWHCVTVCDSV
jgi:hypothetical protein